MENLLPLLPQDDATPETVEAIAWLVSLIKGSDSPVDASANVDIGLALKEKLPWIDDPDLSEAHQRLLELLAGVSLSLCQNTFEINHLRCCTELLEKAMKGRDQGNDLGDDGRLAGLRQLYSQALYQSYLRDEPILNIKTLDKAIEVGEDSVRLTEKLLVERKLDLWTCLYTKSRTEAAEEEGLDAKTLTRSVQIAEEAYDYIEANLKESPLRLRALNNLSLSYQQRSAITEAHEDLERAIELGLELCNILTLEADQPDARVMALANLSIQLLRAYGHYTETGLLPTRLGYQNGQDIVDQAVLCLEKSVGTLCERPRSHLENALSFVLTISKIPKSVRATVLGKISGVLRTCVDRMKEMTLYAIREDLLENLGTFHELSRFAAAAMLEAGCEPYEALKVLDEGRGIALSIQLDSRVDDARLGDADAELRAMYAEAREKLASCVEEDSSLYERHGLVQKVLGLQRQIAAKVPDFETCPPMESLREMAQESTIVVVNVTDIRSDAFIISKDGIRVKPLPSIDDEDLSKRAEALQDGLYQLPGDDVSRDTFSNMREALRILWKGLVLPVLKAIGSGSIHAEGTPWARVCWIPTGVLGLYPIHAAGPYKSARPQDAGAMSRVISSYAPTLKILHRAWSKHHAPDTQHDALSTPLGALKAAVIAEANPTGAGDQKRDNLRRAKRCIEVIQQTFLTVVDDNTSLVIDKPKLSTVSNLLRRDISILQFFCHGTIDYEEPLNSHLVLDDWETSPLTVGTLMKFDLRKSQLAVVSACWGAHAGIERLQDEMNHLTCGLQVAGVLNVIGSLWEAREEDMINLLEVFYQMLGDMGTPLTSKSIGEALHVAIMRVRESTCGDSALSNPLYWAQYVRFGI